MGYYTMDAWQQSDLPGGLPQPVPILANGTLRESDHYLGNPVELMASYPDPWVAHGGLNLTRSDPTIRDSQASKQIDLD